ncbi:MAG: Ig-like domain-containing protein [Candidatus Njordarchaeia archaeon]
MSKLGVFLLLFLLLLPLSLTMYNVALVYEKSGIGSTEDLSLVNNSMETPLRGDGEAVFDGGTIYSTLGTAVNDYVKSVDVGYSFIAFNYTLDYLAWSNEIGNKTIVFIGYNNTPAGCEIDFFNSSGSVLETVSMGQNEKLIKGVVSDNYTLDKDFEVISATFSSATKTIFIYMLDNSTAGLPNLKNQVGSIAIAYVDYNDFLYGLNLDNDDLKELALALYNNTIVFFNYSSTNLLEKIGSVSVGANFSKEDVLIGDLDNDSHEETVVRYYASGESVIDIIGVNSGNMEILRELNISSSNVKLSLGYFNNDDILDLAIVYPASTSSLNVTYYNLVNGSFFSSTYATSENFLSVEDLDVMDFDLDNIDDLIISTLDYSGYSIYGLNATGTTFNRYIKLANFNTAIVKDYNLDGSKELLVNYDNTTNTIVEVYNSSFTQVKKIVYNKLHQVLHGGVRIDEYYPKLMFRNSTTSNYMLVRERNVSLKLFLVEPGVNGLYISESNLNVTWQIRVEGKFLNLTIWRNTTLIKSYSQETNSTQKIDLPTEAVYRISIKAEVVDIGLKEIYFNAIYDVSPPQITNFTPKNQTYFSKTNITVSWNTTDNIKVDQVKILIDNTTEQIYEAANGTSSISLSEGLHELKITVIDLAQNSETQTYLVVIDLTAPKVSMVLPKNNGTIIGEKANFTWNASDNNGIDHYNVYRNGTLISTQSNSNRSIEISFTKEGYYIIEVIAFDLAGNMNKTAVMVEVDLTSPKLTSVNPANLTNVGKHLNLTWSINESNLESLTIIRNGTVVGYMDETNYTNGIMIETEMNGGLNITILIKDKAGNTASYMLLYHVDLEPINFQVAEPENNTYTNTTTITIHLDNLNETDFNMLIVVLNNQTVAEYSVPVGTLNIALDEGFNKINITAIDDVGNTKTVLLNVIVDLKPPSLEVNYIEYVNETPTTIGINATDNSGILGVDLVVNGVLHHYNISGNVSIPVQLTIGNNTLRIVVYDYAGNSVEKKIWIILDETQPAIKVFEPNNCSYLNMFNVKLNFSASDNLSGVKSVYVFMNGILVGENTYVLNLTLPYDGKYLVKIRVLDKSGNVAEETIVLVRDTIKPVIKILEPENGTIINQTLHLEIGLDEMNPSKIMVYVEGKKALTVENKTSLVSNLTIEKAGVNKIEVYAVDKAGNENFEILYVTCDLEPPTLNVKVSKENPVVGETIFIFINASDNYGIKIIQVYIDNKFYGYLLQSNTAMEIKFNTTGIHTLNIRALDLAYNSKSVVLEFNVREKGGGQGLDVMFVFSFIVPVAIITGVILGYVKTKRR